MHKESAKNMFKKNIKQIKHLESFTSKSEVFFLSFRAYSAGALLCLQYVAIHLG